jgi:hypothetical protein
MSGHTGIYAAAWRRYAQHWKRRLRRYAPAALAVMLQACASTASGPISRNDPSNAAAPAPAVRYRSTIGPYESRRPVDPAPWRPQNQQVTPPTGSGQ